MRETRQRDEPATSRYFVHFDERKGRLTPMLARPTGRSFETSWTSSIGRVAAKRKQTKRRFSITVAIVGSVKRNENGNVRREPVSTKRRREVLCRASAMARRASFQSASRPGASESYEREHGREESAREAKELPRDCEGLTRISYRL
jgi:hypothetical protein